MAFTIEAALTVPLSLSLLFSSVARLPQLEQRLYLQARACGISVRESIGDEDLFSIQDGSDEYVLATCMTSPRKMQEAISLGIDLIQIAKHRSSN